MRPAISSEKKTATPIKKKYSASTRGAIVDARSGKSGGMALSSRDSGFGIWDSLGIWDSFGIRAWIGGRDSIPFPPHHDENEHAEREDGGGAGETDGAHDEEA